MVGSLRERSPPRATAPPAEKREETMLEKEKEGEREAKCFSGTFKCCLICDTGISSHLGAKLRDWADRQAEAGCCSWADQSSNDSKTRYII